MDYGGCVNAKCLHNQLKQIVVFRVLVICFRFLFTPLTDLNGLTDTQHI